MLYGIEMAEECIAHFRSTQKFGTSKHVENLGEWDWKMVVIFQAMVPLFIVIQVPFVRPTRRKLKV